MKATRGLALTLFAILSLVSGAHARAEELGEGTPSGPKSSTVGTFASVIGTAVPVAFGIVAGNSSDWEEDAGTLMVLSGYVIGPSLGHFYAGRSGAAFGGMGLRLLPVVGLSAAIAASWDSPSKAADVMAAGSLALGAGLVVWDFARVSKSVRSYNEEHAHPRVSLGLVPGSRELTPAIRLDIPM